MHLPNATSSATTTVLTSGTHSRWRELARSPWFITAVALAFRLLVLTLGHTYKINPRRDHFEFGWEMGRIARSLALGQGFSSPLDIPTGATAWAAPLYPWLLAGVFKIAGIYTQGAAWLIFAVNSVFSALTCLTLYGIGKRAFGETTARWCAWTWALFPYAIYWAVRVVWETSLSALLLSAAFLLTLRLEESPRRRDWVLYGLLWGLVSLTNPTLLSFLPVSLGWVWFRLRQRQARFLLNATFSMLLAAVMVLPWLIRDYRTFGRFVFIRDNFGLELRAANNEHSSGTWTRSEHPGNDPEQMRTMQRMGEIHYMQAMQKAAVGYIRQHPGTFAVNSLKRIAYFWAGKPQNTLVASYDLAPARHMAFLLTALFPLAGLWLAVRNRRPAVWLFSALLLVFPLPYYVAHSTPRYRHPIEPIMLLLTVYLIYEGRKIQLAVRSA